MIEFASPCLDIPLVEYTKFPDLLSKASSAVAFVIGLGKRFVEDGIRELDETILPELKRDIGELAIPRVLPSYAILMWFTLEVCSYIHSIGIYVLFTIEHTILQIMRAAEIDYLREELLAHFSERMAPCIARLQPASKHRAIKKDIPLPAVSSSLDAFGEEVLQCCKGLNRYKVRTSFLFAALQLP